MMELQLLRIEPAPPGDEGVRITVTKQDGTTEIWKALAVEVALDVTPTVRTPQAGSEEQVAGQNCFAVVAYVSPFTIESG